MSSDDSATLPLTAVRSGARLTSAVLGADGQVLMTAGSLLTAATLERLAARGVTVVAVEVGSLRGEAELGAARAALRQRLAHLFRRCKLEDDSLAAQKLFKAVLDHRLEALR